MQNPSKPVQEPGRHGCDSASAPHQGQPWVFTLLEDGSDVRADQSGSRPFLKLVLQPRTNADRPIRDARSKGRPSEAGVVVCDHRSPIGLATLLGRTLLLLESVAQAPPRTLQLQRVLDGLNSCIGIKRRDLRQCNRELAKMGDQMPHLTPLVVALFGH